MNDSCVQYTVGSPGLWIESLLRISTGAAGEFSPPELTFCADSYSVSLSQCPLFSVRSTPVLPQWHVKDPGQVS